MTTDEIVRTTALMRWTSLEAMKERLALLVSDEEWDALESYCNALQLWPQFRGGERVTTNLKVNGVRILRKELVDGM